MNLTSKRILKGLAVCVGACALSATAETNWVADAFEDGAADQAIYTYKADVHNSGQNTNFLWESQAGDASKLVSTTDQEAYSGIRPITNVNKDLHLQLETEGTTLVRYLGRAPAAESAWTGQTVPVDVPFNESDVYINTLIKFTPSEDDPEISGDVKVAVFVNANSNLVVYHTIYDSEYGDDGVLGNSVFDNITIDPEAWYRLTIKLGYELNEPCFQIFLNQNALSHLNAWTTGFAKNGTWFVSAGGQNFNVSQVSFQGTGAIDEFVIADDADLGGSEAVMLTLSFDETKVTVWNMLLDEAVADDGTVANGTEIAIEASANWYEIFSVVGEDTGSFAGTPVPGAAITATTGTVSATVSDTLTITAQQFSGGTVSTGLGGGSLPAKKVAAWATGQDPQLGVDDLTSAMLGEYLLDVPAGTDDTISITSITVDSGTGEVTITVEAANALVDLGDINGFLSVVTSDTLPVSGTPTYIPFNAPGGVATIVIPNSGKFIKVTVEATQPVQAE